MWPDAPAVVGEHLAGSGQSRIDPGQHERRVEVALHDEVVTQPAPGVADRRAPVEPEHGRSGRVHRFEEVVAADAEVDRRRVRVAGAEFVEHPPRVGQHVPVVVAAGERAGPRVEQLEGAGAVAELGVDEGDGRFGEPVHQVVPQALVALDQRLGVAVVAARPALDQIAGDGERRSGERQERHARWEFLGEQADRVDARSRRRRRRAGGGGRDRPGVRSGCSATGPVPGATSIPNPTACAGTTMSLNRTAASTPYRRTGCNVISAATSGRLMASRIEPSPRTARYSGSDRPAWRMNHTGVAIHRPPPQRRRERER